MLSKASSNLFTLNGDKFQRRSTTRLVLSAVWLAVGLSDQLKGLIHRRKLNRFNAARRLVESLEEESYKKTPTRFQCDLYWQSLDWELIRKKYGTKLKILDIGCGNGGLAEALRKSADGKVKIDYIGMDHVARPEWSEYQDCESLRLEFIEIDVYLIKSILHSVEPDLVVSQSAFEHFERDLDVLEVLNAYRETRPCDLIILVPAVFSLILYLVHGVRVYSSWSIERAVQKIVSGFGYVEVVAIGNIQDVWLHFRYLTLTWVLSGGKRKPYTRYSDRYTCAHMAINWFRHSKPAFGTTFYAVTTLGKKILN